jgi:hypothetical protein
LKEPFLTRAQFSSAVEVAVLPGFPVSLSLPHEARTAGRVLFLQPQGVSLTRRRPAFVFTAQMIRPHKNTESYGLTRQRFVLSKMTAGRQPFATPQKASQYGDVPNSEGSC